MDEIVDNPFLPTPLHVLFQLPDGRVPLARELLRRNSDAKKQRREDAPVPREFVADLTLSFEQRALFHEVSSGGGSMHTLTTSELAAAVHGSQVPFVALLLAHSADVAALLARTDKWQRNAVHMAARAGNTKAVALMQLDKRTLSAQDTTGHTPLHSAAMHGYAETLAALVDGGQTLGDWAMIRTTRGPANLTFSEIQPRSRPPYETPRTGRPNHEPSLTARTVGGDWEEDGGNSADVLDPVLLGRGGECSIDTRHVSDLTPVEFLFEYLVPGRPVRLQGATVSSEWQFREAWARKKLLANHGGIVLPHSDIPYEELFTSQPGHATGASTLAQFINHMPTMNERLKDTSVGARGATPPYIFFGGINKSDPLLADAFPLVPEFLRFESSTSTSDSEPVDWTVAPAATQWYLGPPGSGAPIHFHQDAWNALAYGSKRWLLLPPGESRYSSQPILDLLTSSDFASSLMQPEHPAEDSDAGAGDKDSSTSTHQGPEVAAPLECVQAAGEVMFIPNNWGHAVLNLESVVGVAVEFGWGPKPKSKGGE